MPRGFACVAAALTVLLYCAPANAAPGPRIINGQPADEGEYPAQGFVELTTNEGTYVCGGTLVSNRHFLTAGHCATQPGTNAPLLPNKLRVTLGKTDKGDFTAADRYSVTQNTLHAAYDWHAPDNDVALLTLATKAPPALEPLRVIESGETGLWAAGATATIVGWGTTEGGQLSDQLLEAKVPMVSDADCTEAWGASFDAVTMVCAGGGDTDTCGGDSGGPLMVGDGAFLVLAGITSWGADPCAEPGVPGVYTRLGAPALNTWVRERVPMARVSVSDAAVDPSDTVTFSVAATHPTVPGDFTSFAWDFDSDGTPDASGAEVTHAYPAEGRYVARVTAAGEGDDTARDKVAMVVGDPRPGPTPTPTPEPTATPRPAPTTQPSPGPAPAPVGATSPPSVVTVTSGGLQGPLATILVGKRPRVRNGRFAIRIRFARTAPAGTAVVELLRRGRVIGIARTTVRRGATTRVRVRLTPRGRRLLARSRSRRLAVKVRVRVGRPVLRSKRLTVRR